ncbi:MAG: hypothetical protein KBA29_09395, partial [Moraxellaceae bacterium]|nr:hypothetical protein [Moraxellaceae bacterium]
MPYGHVFLKVTAVLSAGKHNNAKANSRCRPATALCAACLRERQKGQGSVRSRGGCSLCANDLARVLS